MTDKPTPEQIQRACDREAGMTRDEAEKLAAEVVVTAVNDGGLPAAATVIQQAFAERDGEIERLRDALDKAAARLNLAANYMATSFGISGTLRAERMIKLQDCAAEALAAKGDRRG